MRSSTFVMTGFAVVFGLLAVFLAQNWLNGEVAQRAHVETAAPAMAMKTIVVAAQPLRFGSKLEAGMLREVSWPASELPAGAFGKVGDVVSGGPRLVLAAMESNEPVLALKITGAGQRATLSALVAPGMKAVTIRVNDIEGVGGFVLPGERVDVILTRPKANEATSEIVLQNVRVLATDQSADDRTTKAAVAKSVTLEVATVEAQKVWLAASVGSLSLLLRRAGETAEARTRKISLKDLAAPDGERGADTTTIGVLRAATRQEYTVPVEEAGRLAAAGEPR
jgi:pilus assembly protein CpaB